MSAALMRWPARIMALGLVIVPTQTVYYPRTAVVTCILVALAALVSAWGRKAWDKPDRAVAVAFALLLGWTVISASWALDAALAFRDSIGLAATMVIALAGSAAAARMEAQDRRLLLWAAVAGLVVAWGFTTMELVFDGVLLRYRSSYNYGLPTVMKPGNTVAIVMLAPAAAALLTLGRPRLAALLVAAWLAIMPFSYSEAARIGSVVLVATIMLVKFRPLWGPRLIMGGLAILVFALPVALHRLPTPQQIWDQHAGLKNSAHHRLAIWRFAGQRIAEHPVIGWGMNSSRVMPGAEDEHLYQRTRPDGSLEQFRETNLPLHPHNVVVQWWLELGGIGAALGLAVVVALIRLGGRVKRPGWHRALAIGTVVGAMSMSMTAYGAWQSWWLAILALSAMILTLAGRDESLS
ncbi:MAG: O-antigen ligase family protein [Magnetospirillum sp.]|nr:O-antigen ligase family protein [Magnetospirillum sp.]